MKKLISQDSFEDFSRGLERNILSQGIEVELEF